MRNPVDFISSIGQFAAARSLQHHVVLTDALSKASMRQIELLRSARTGNRVRKPRCRKVRNLRGNARAEQSMRSKRRVAYWHCENAIDAMSASMPQELRCQIARVSIANEAWKAIPPSAVHPRLLSSETANVLGDNNLFYADYGQNASYGCCLSNSASHKEQEGAVANKRDLNMHNMENERVELEILEPFAQPGPAVCAQNLVERVPVALTVELGRTNISVKELRLLRQGQIIGLDQMVGEPLGIFANGHRIASGEVVSVARDQYGIRVTALADANEQAKDFSA